MAVAQKGDPSAAKSGEVVHINTNRSAGDARSYTTSKSSGSSSSTVSPNDPVFDSLRGGTYHSQSFGLNGAAPGTTPTVQVETKTQPTTTASKQQSTNTTTSKSQPTSSSSSSNTYTASAATPQSVKPDTTTPPVKQETAAKASTPKNTMETTETKDVYQTPTGRVSMASSNVSPVFTPQDKPQSLKPTATTETKQVGVWQADTTRKTFFGEMENKLIQEKRSADMRQDYMMSQLMTMGTFFTGAGKGLEDAAESIYGVGKSITDKRNKYAQKPIEELTSTKIDQEKTIDVIKSTPFVAAGIIATAPNVISNIGIDAGENIQRNPLGSVGYVIGTVAGGELIGGVAGKAASTFSKTESTIVTDIIERSADMKAVKGVSVTTTETTVPVIGNIKSVGKSTTITQEAPEQLANTESIAVEKGFISRFKNGVAKKPEEYTTYSAISKPREINSMFSVVSQDAMTTSPKGLQSVKQTLSGSTKFTEEGIINKAGTITKNDIKTDVFEGVTTKGSFTQNVNEYIGSMTTKDLVGGGSTKTVVTTATDLSKVSGIGSITEHGKIVQQEIERQITKPVKTGGSFSRAINNPLVGETKNPLAVTTNPFTSTKESTSVKIIPTHVQSSISKTKAMVNSVTNIIPETKTITQTNSFSSSKQWTGNISSQSQKSNQAQRQIQEAISDFVEPKLKNTFRTSAPTRMNVPELIFPKLKPLPFKLPEERNRQTGVLSKMFGGYSPFFINKGGGGFLSDKVFSTKAMAESYGAEMSLKSKNIIGFNISETDRSNYSIVKKKVTDYDISKFFNVERGGFIEKPSSVNPSSIKHYKFAEFMKKIR